MRHFKGFLLILLLCLLPAVCLAARTDASLDMLMALLMDPANEYPLTEGRATTFGAAEFQKYRNDGIELSDYNAMAQFDPSKGTIILCGQTGTVRNVRYWRRLSKETVMNAALIILNRFDDILERTNRKFIVVLTLDERRLLASDAGNAASLAELLERRLSPSDAL